MLKLTIESLAEAAKGTEGYYTEGEDGKFHLQVEGLPQDMSGDVDRLKRSLDSERNAHKETKQKFGWVGDLTEASVRELKDAQEDLKYQLENANGPSQEEIEERAERLAARKTRDLEQQLNSTSETLSNYQQAITLHEAAANQRKIRDAVEEVLSASDSLKVHDSAREDIYPYAERIMTVDPETGQVISKEGVGVDPGLSVKDVLTDIQTSGRRSHWFKGNKSGGLESGGGGNPITGPNPFDREGGTFNLGLASKMVKEDPRKAKALCLKAGQKLEAFGLQNVA